MMNDNQKRLHDILSKPVTSKNSSKIRSDVREILKKDLIKSFSNDEKDLIINLALNGIYLNIPVTKIDIGDKNNYYILFKSTSTKYASVKILIQDCMRHGLEKALSDNLEILMSDKHLELQFNVTKTLTYLHMTQPKTYENVLQSLRIGELKPSDLRFNDYINKIDIESLKIATKRAKKEQHLSLNLYNKLRDTLEG